MNIYPIIFVGFILSLIFRSLIHFELTFAMKQGHLHSLACGNPVVSALFVEETILFLLNGLGALVENQLAIDVWFSV